jgi:23S rRNA (cytosine1962-C5)-methyltransferase
LKNATRQQDHYDLVILDPPSFTRSKSRTQDAMRGYKEIHLRSLQMMRPGDILATFTCSHHVGESEFLQAVSSASVDARTNLRLLERLGQGLDHPVVLTMPETEYLRGYIFEVMPGR